MVLVTYLKKEQIIIIYFTFDNICTNKFSIFLIFFRSLPLIDLRLSVCFLALKKILQMAGVYRLGVTWTPQFTAQLTWSAVVVQPGLHHSQLLSFVVYGPLRVLSPPFTLIKYFITPLVAVSLQFETYVIYKHNVFWMGVRGDLKILNVLWPCHECMRLIQQRR